MPNIKQQKKRARTDAAKAKRKRSFLSATKTVIKKADNLVKEKSEKAIDMVRLAKKRIDQLVTKKIKKQNFANRKKRQMDLKMQEMEKMKTEKSQPETQTIKSKKTLKKQKV